MELYGVDVSTLLIGAFFAFFVPCIYFKFNFNRPIFLHFYLVYSFFLVLVFLEGINYLIIVNLLLSLVEAIVSICMFVLVLGVIFSLKIRILRYFSSGKSSVPISSKYSLIDDIKTGSILVYNKVLLWLIKYNLGEILAKEDYEKKVDKKLNINNSNVIVLNRYGWALITIIVLLLVVFHYYVQPFKHFFSTIF
tara:strand:- start:636 stop:1217 length:582 start_codon:yes stop_codon:yes gene_type:complete